MDIITFRDFSAIGCRHHAFSLTMPSFRFMISALTLIKKPPKLAYRRLGISISAHRRRYSRKRNYFCFCNDGQTAACPDEQMPALHAPVMLRFLMPHTRFDLTTFSNTGGILPSLAIFVSISPAKCQSADECRLILPHGRLQHMILRVKRQPFHHHHRIISWLA